MPQDKPKGEWLIAWITVAGKEPRAWFNTEAQAEDALKEMFAAGSGPDYKVMSYQEYLAFPIKNLAKKPKNAASKAFDPEEFIKERALIHFYSTKGREVKAPDKASSIQIGYSHGDIQPNQFKDLIPVIKKKFGGNWKFDHVDDFGSMGIGAAWFKRSNKATSKKEWVVAEITDNYKDIASEGLHSKEAAEKTRLKIAKLGYNLKDLEVMTRAAYEDNPLLEKSQVMGSGRRALQYQSKKKKAKSESMGKKRSAFAEEESPIYTIVLWDDVEKGKRIPFKDVTHAYVGKRAAKRDKSPGYRIPMFKLGGKWQAYSESTGESLFEMTRGEIPKGFKRVTKAEAEKLIPKYGAKKGQKRNQACGEEENEAPKGAGVSEPLDDKKTVHDKPVVVKIGRSTKAAIKVLSYQALRYSWTAKEKPMERYHYIIEVSNPATKLAKQFDYYGSHHDFNMGKVDLTDEDKLNVLSMLFEDAGRYQNTSEEGLVDELGFTSKKEAMPTIRAMKSTHTKFVALFPDLSADEFDIMAFDLRVLAGEDTGEPSLVKLA